MLEKKFPFALRSRRIGRNIFLPIKDAVPGIDFVVPVQFLHEMVPPESVLQRRTGRTRPFSGGVLDVRQSGRFFQWQTAWIELLHKRGRAPDRARLVDLVRGKADVDLRGARSGFPSLMFRGHCASVRLATDI